MFISDIAEGTFELTRMKLNISRGEVNNYPVHLEVLKNINYKMLYNEYLKTKDLLSTNYLAERGPFLKYSLPTIYDSMNRVGFKKGKYISYSMINLGTNQFKKCIPKYTKSLVNQFKPTCRMHYALAKPGWKSKKHVDYKDFKTQGFRIHIPINKPLHLIFYKCGKKLSLTLQPGKAWFLNVAIPHESNNPYSEDRISLTFQVMSDNIFNNSQIL